MSARELLAECQARGMALSLVGDALTFDAPADFPDELIEKLRAHRDELRAYLASQSGDATFCPVANSGRPSVDNAPCFIHHGEGTPRTPLAPSAPKQPILPPAICVDCREPIAGSVARCAPCAGEAVDRWLRGRKAE